MNVKQKMVEDWVRRTFGDASQDDPRERSLRFIEEAIEFVQAIGEISPSDIFQLVDRIYERPPGSPKQEAGGVMITMMALCSNQKIGYRTCANTEWWRINSPQAQERMQQRQKEKYAMEGKDVK